ncbi:MAG: NAD(P)-dependent oxidoreductase [Caldilineaceae bacterium]
MGAKCHPARATGIDIQGKTLGVISFGRIGQTIPRLYQGLGMKTIWYDVFDTPHPGAPKGEYRSLDAYWPNPTLSLSTLIWMPVPPPHRLPNCESSRQPFLINTAWQPGQSNR